MSTELPQIAACFVTVFHKSEGYKIIFARSHEIDLDGCEYKTLPSGVEKIKEDVIYFTHGARRQYTGIAVYRNLQEAGAERKDITCVSIAVMVLAESHNLRHQRLNKVWLFNTALHDLASKFDASSSDYFDEVEALYDQHKNVKTHVSLARNQSPPASPILSRHSSYKNYTSFREERHLNQAKTTSLLPNHVLSNLHPVLSLHDLISFFGPLIFPLYRAALCRKRILLVTEAPVQRACHFIYNIQLISAIPNSATTLRRPSPLRQLFCLSLNDIPELEKYASDDDQPGWIGVTTDKMLSKKTHLYDYLIELPSEHTTMSLATDRARPTITTSDGVRIQPSYLDGRNFSKLKPCLPIYRDTGLTIRPQISWKRSIVDSVFSGFLYWASAGQSVDFEETEPLSSPTQTHDFDEEAPLMPSSHLTNGRDEVLTLVLFHRLTNAILSLIDEVCCESHDSDLYISRTQAVSLGLTPRLPSDQAFISQLGQRWFARTITVDSSFWPCC